MEENYAKLLNKGAQTSAFPGNLPFSSFKFVKFWFLFVGRTRVIGGGGASPDICWAEGVWGGSDRLTRSLRRCGRKAFDILTMFALGIRRYWFWFFHGVSQESDK